MKLSKLNIEKSTKFINVFQKYKEYLIKLNKDSFFLEGFINFVNTSDLDVVGYKWHQDENSLESSYFGRIAIPFSTALECLANTSEKSYLLDDNGSKIILLTKLGPKKYKLI
jgi:hypothetical protein